MAVIEMVEMIHPDLPGQTAQIPAETAHLWERSGWRIATEPPHLEQMPAYNARRAEWVEYADLVGVRVSRSMPRDAIRDAVLAQIDGRVAGEPPVPHGDESTPSEED